MEINTDKKSLDAVVGRGVEDVADKDSLWSKLASGRRLRVKFGIDPTAPDIHLGHSVVLRKLRQFQDLGHLAVLIIGDFTALVGDPSGRSSSRPALVPEQIRDNMKDYIKQAAKIIDIDKAEIHYNSEWFGKKQMAFLMDLASRFTVARMIEREDFHKRLKDGVDVSVLEILYPLLQGYDSVAVKADIELGGYDQRLNLLFGRKVQRAFGQPEQDIITVPLLVGIDGEKKMSKSANNYIGINEAPEEMFAGIMKIPDNLMWSYFELLTKISKSEAEKLKQGIAREAIHPRDVKMQLAAAVVRNFYPEERAIAAKGEFVRVAQENLLPSNIPMIKIKPGEMGILDFLVAITAAPSKSRAKQLIEQGGVRINDEIKNDWKEVVKIKPGIIVRIGKTKFFKTA